MSIVLHTVAFIIHSSLETLMRVRLQRVLPDGACLFRSLATSLIYAFSGASGGFGAPFGRETTGPEVLHNLVTRWVRTLVVVSLCGYEVSIRTKLGPRSLYDVLRAGCALLRDDSGNTRKFNRLRRQTPSIPVLVCKPEQRYAGTDVTRAIVCASGMRPDETVHDYCERMLRPNEWGGEAELFAASRVLQVPITVYTGRRSFSTYYPRGWEQSTQRNFWKLRLLFRADQQHYDALLHGESDPATTILGWSVPRK